MGRTGLPVVALAKIGGWGNGKTHEPKDTSPRIHDFGLIVGLFGFGDRIGDGFLTDLLVMPEGSIGAASRPCR